MKRLRNPSVQIWISRVLFLVFLPTKRLLKSDVKEKMNSEIYNRFFENESER